ncbi:mercuric reductase [soil metagenome]|nr:mercuric reductase [Gemmatimonadota bacterium]
MSKSATVDSGESQSASDLPAAVRPYDVHNRRLHENVHPPEWTNPRARGKYQLVVIGAGTAGLVTAAIAAALGARVALVERGLMGGDCLNVGCVPSKALIRAARGWKAARTVEERFGGPAASGEGDFAQVMERMREIRAGISDHDSARRFSGLGVDVFLGSACFTGEDAVRVGDQTLRFRRAVIATGSSPSVPPIPGLPESGYLTNETIFSLTERPRELVVIGGGPIGCEMAQAFARFGSRVTLLEAGKGILSLDEADAARVVEKALREDGVDLVTDAEVTAVERAGKRRTVRYRRGGESDSVECDQLLVAAGRTPNIEGLGLEAAGVRFLGKNGPKVDDRLQTTNRRIYAVGDVSSSYPFTHVADAQARMVVRNALFFGRSKASDLVIPWCTYTSPELAHVGLSAEEVRSRGDNIDTITIPLAEVDRARLDGETEGFFRVHLKRGSDEILAATLVAEHAGEIISQLTQAMTTGTGLGELGSVIFPYPTQAEAIRKAADQWRRRRLTPLAQSVFRSFFALMR